MSQAIYQLRSVTMTGQIGIHTNVYPPPPPIARFICSQLGSAIVASDVVASDQFGRSIALHEATLVVGAPNHEVGGNTGAGAIYVYVYSNGGWDYVTTLTGGAYIEASAQLGYSVAVYGDYIVAGAYLENGSRGAAYVFKRTNGIWGTDPVARLVSTDQQAGAQFGMSVSLHGSIIAIGAPGDDVDGSGLNAGRVHVFTGSNASWTLETVLTATVPESGAEFGISLSSNSNSIAVGAWKENVRSGAVYIYTRNAPGQWSSVRVVPDQEIENSRFGTSLELKGTSLIVGAPVGEGGCAYIFENSNQWNQRAILNARNTGGLITDSSVSSIDSQGISVSIDPSFDIAIVGAQRNDNGTGCAYLYENVYGRWKPSAIQPISKIKASDGTMNDYFGLPVIVDSGKIIVGASRRDSNGNGDAGAIYAFQ